MPRKSLRTRTTRYRRKSKSSARRSGRSAYKATAKLVKRVLYKQAETKCQTVDQLGSQLNPPIFGAAPVPFGTGAPLNAPPNMWTVWPSIGQGTTQGARVGNKVQRPIMYIKGCVAIDPTLGLGGQPQPFAGFQRIQVRIMVISSKIYRAASDLYANWAIEGASLFQYAGSSTYYQANNPQLQWYVPNKDRFNVYMDKKVVLTCDPANLTGSARYGLDGRSYAKFAKKISYGHWQFDDNSFAGKPTNYHEPVIVCFYTNLTGNGVVDQMNAGTNYVRLNYVANTWYKDV